MQREEMSRNEWQLIDANIKLVNERKIMLNDIKTLIQYIRDTKKVDQDLIKHIIKEYEQPKY